MFNTLHLYSQNDNNMTTLTNEQIVKLINSANSLFEQGISSTKFARLLHNDYQIICNDDLNSNDDFYNLASEANKPMRDLLNLLGFQYTQFGISLFKNYSLKLS